MEQYKNQTLKCIKYIWWIRNIYPDKDLLLPPSAEILSRPHLGNNQLLKFSCRLFRLIHSEANAVFIAVFTGVELSMVFFFQFIYLNEDLSLARPSRPTTIVQEARTDKPNSFWAPVVFVTVWTTNTQEEKMLRLNWAVNLNKPLNCQQVSSATIINQKKFSPFRS